MLAAPAAPQLHATPSMSSDGVIQLHWDTAGRPVELQRAVSADFSRAETLYRGNDGASLRSGLADGRYVYRLRALDPQGRPGPWSAPLAVEVAHHPLRRAWGMFGLGALVFVAILGMILWGARREAGDG